MLFSRWQKQNRKLQDIIWVIAAIIAFFIALLFKPLGPEAQGAIAVILYFVLHFLFATLISYLYADSLVGAIKFEYTEIERDFRLIFKENAIRFYRKIEDESYSYEFPGRHLAMMVQHYPVPGRDGQLQPAAKVTLYPLNEQNEEFVGMLVSAIDDMAKRLAKRSPKKR